LSSNKRFSTSPQPFVRTLLKLKLAVEGRPAVQGRDQVGLQLADDGRPCAVLQWEPEEGWPALADRFRDLPLG